MMTSLTRLGLLAAVLVTFSGSASATSALLQTTQQETPRPGGPGQGQHPAAPGPDQFKDLNLTVKQKKQVEAIFQEQRQQMEAQRKTAAPPQKNSADRDKIGADMRRADTATDAKLKAVLTADQYKKYQAKKRDRPQPPQNGQRPPQPEVNN